MTSASCYVCMQDRGCEKKSLPEKMTSLGKGFVLIKVLILDTRQRRLQIADSVFRLLLWLLHEGICSIYCFLLD